MVTKFVDSTIGIRKGLVNKTAQATTIYVRSAGNDNNDGLTVGTSLATIQEAIDRLPEIIYHDIKIDIGSGNFTGFVLRRIVVLRGVKLEIEGTLGNPTLASGTVSGTATGGSTTTLVDSGQSWTVDDLVGSFLRVGSDYRVIRSNTSDTITLSAPFSTSTSGKAYEIFEPKTVIDTPPTASPGWDGYEMIGVFDLDADSQSLAAIRNLKVDGDSQNYDGMDIYYGRGLTVERCQLVDNFWGLFASSMTSGYGYFYEVYVENFAQYGVYFFTCTCYHQARVFVNGGSGVGLCVLDGYSTQASGTVENCTGADGNGVLFVRCNKADLDSFWSKNNAQHGIKILTVNFFDWDVGVSEDNGGYGLYVDENSTTNRYAGSAVNLFGTITIQNNSSGGIVCKSHSVLAMTGVTGSNTGYGLTLEVKSYAVITSATTITGSTADATIDSITPITWATHFANDGDTLNNPANGCRIERKD